MRRRVGQRQEDVEVELKAKGTPLHAATVVGDTVGDPFKDTSSVAMNPVIKFTTLFGILAVQLAVRLAADAGSTTTLAVAAVFFALSLVFVWRSSTECGSAPTRRNDVRPLKIGGFWSKSAPGRFRLRGV